MPYVSDKRVIVVQYRLNNCLNKVESMKMKEDVKSTKKKINIKNQDDFARYFQVGTTAIIDSSGLKTKIGSNAKVI